MNDSSLSKKKGVYMSIFEGADKHNIDKNHNTVEFTDKSNGIVLLNKILNSTPISTQSYWDHHTDWANHADAYNILKDKQPILRG